MDTRNRIERNEGFAFILTFILMALGVILTGFFYYHNYERHFRTSVESQLSSIAQLKVGELSLWRRERLGDGSIVFKNATFSALVRNFLENPKDTEAQEHLRAWMGKYITAYQYAQVTLFDTHGSLRALEPENGEMVDMEISHSVPEILRGGRVVFQDFHREDTDGPIHLGVVVPIFDELDETRPLGVLLLDIDPTTYLYPFISRWPTPNQTGETLLVRRDGNDALFLNDLKFHKNAALNLRIPLTKTEVPAVKAVLGQTGIVEGLDYRGEPVIANVSFVSDSPWRMVSKMNTSEAYAPVRERLWMTFTLVGGLLFGAGVAMGLIWRQRSARYREREKATEALEESEARFHLLADATFEGVIITENGRILDVNKSFLEMAGYEKPEELVGRSSLEFVAPEYRDIVANNIAIAYDKPYEIRGIRKDGSTIPIEVNGRTRQIAGRQIRFTAVQNITERKRAQERLRRSEENLNRAQAVGEIGSWFLDIPTNRLEWSAESHRIFGVPQREAVDLATFVSALHPDDRDFVLKAWNDAIAGAPYDIEHRIVVNGQTRWVRERAQLERDSEGRALTGIGTTQDITERKKVDETLRLHSDILKNLSEGVYLIRVSDGMIVFANERFDSMFGYDPGESIGKHVSIVNAPGEKTPEARVQEIMYELLRTGTWKGETLNIRKDGTVFWCYANVTTFDHPQFGPVWVSVHEDITERKKAEEKLRRNATLLGEAQKVARIGHWEWEIKSDVVTWSDEMFRILGYEPGSITPSMKMFMNSVPSEDRERVNRIIGESITGEVRYFMDRVVVTPDGTRRIVHAEGEVVHDESGAPLRMFAVVQDVTESKENENRIKLFREALELSSDAVYIIDGETARPVDFNPAAHEQLGYTREEMFGLTVFDIIVAEPDEFTWKDRVKQIKESGGLIVERNHRKKDGSLTPVETSLSVADVGGKEYVVAVVRDTSERAKMREMEITAKSLELTNRELKEFAHVASHDLQEPLRTIIAFSERLETKFGTEFSPKALDYMRRIRAAGERMSHLLRDLLRYSLVSGGHLNFDRVDLNQIATEILEDMRGAIEESGARLNISYLPVVSADALQIRQLLQNLISNAIKYHKPGQSPDIRIYSRGIRAPMGKRNAIWEIVVEDDGIGFNNEYAEKIFKIFERLHGHSEYEGTGVGLATARKIVERHGWTIKAEGEPGVGSKFTILAISLEG